MTKQEYQQRFQDLNNQIEKLKLEYVNSLPFKKGGFRSGKQQRQVY